MERRKIEQYMPIDKKQTIKKQYEIHTASAINISEIVEFLAHIFGPNYRKARKTQNSILTNEPSKKSKNFIIARSSAGKLIGLVRIVERRIWIGDAPISYAGISSVSVHADWRRKGIASDLMEYAIQEMQKRKIPFSLLYGRRAVDGFYTKYGYYGIGQYRTCELLLNSIGKKHDRVLTAIRYSPRFAHFLSKEYNRMYRTLPGSIVRDRGVWRYLLTRTQESKTPTIFILLDRSSKRPIGYYVSKENTISECAAPKQWFNALLSYIYQHGIKKLELHPKHPFDRYLRHSVNTITHERFALDGGYMARVIDWKLLLEKILPILVARAKSAGYSHEKLTIRGYTIDFTHGTLKRAITKNDIHGSEHHIIQLVIGFHALDELDLTINPKKQWISCLFTKTGFHTSAWDEI